MKKFLSMLMVASLALFAAMGCSDDDEVTPPEKKSQFSGMISVMDGDENTAYTGQDIIFETVAGDNNSITVTMNQVKFSTHMPVALNIVLPNVTYISDNVYGTETITATATDGEPYTYVTVSNVSVLTVGTTLTVTFDCLYNGLTYKVTYTGSAVVE